MNALNLTAASEAPPTIHDTALPAGLEGRILILAPTENDARLTADVLSRAGFVPHICRDTSDLTIEIAQDCGAILLAEEALSARSASGLVQELARQPAWSDIPMVIITSRGEAGQTRLRRLAVFGPGGNVALIERPFHPGTLLSTVEVALRARRRQYQARDLLQTITALSTKIKEQARLFNITLSHISDFTYIFDSGGRFLYANQPLLDLWGLTLEQAIGKDFFDLHYPDKLAARLHRQIQQVIHTKECLKDETPYRSPKGVEGYYEYILNPVLAPDGTVEMVAGSTRNITERKRAGAMAESQRRVLQLMAEDAPLDEVLESLVHTVELAYSHKVYGSIFLMDAAGAHPRYGVASNLPAVLRKAMEGIVLGASAGFTQQPVHATDIASDPLWAGAKGLALEHGLRAGWSIPILSGQGNVMGTFALYLGELRSPDNRDLRIMETAVRTAAIAIERKASDAAVRESERQYSQLVRSLPAAVYTTDAHGYVKLFNEAAVALWGRRPKAGKDLWNASYRIFRPDGTPLAMDQCPLAITLKEGRSVRGEEIIIERPDGSRRNVVPYPDPIHDASGKVVGAINMLLDVTESRQAEEASRRLAAIVESSDEAIFSKDLSSLIRTWNRGAERLFGYRAEEVIGKPVTVLMPPERWNEEPHILAQIQRGERIEHYETIRKRKDGSLVEVSLTVSPIRDAKGNVTGASKIVRDITRQKQAERDLERAHQTVLAASRAKDEFLAALSHELRTPLNPALLLASEAADDPQLAPEVRARFTTIRNSVELEARLIDDLLDITRIAHGKVSLNTGLVDVHGLLKEALVTVRSELDHKRLQLKVDLTAEHFEVDGDALRLQQVLWNVLKNAVKFTPAGGAVAVRTCSNAEAGKLAIVITDSGIGMTRDELGSIFQAFAQGEHEGAGGAHRFGGLGLGLAISRSLVELHAGSICASSAGRDRGSTFTITLPLAARSGRTTEPKEGEISPPQSALVEDAGRMDVLLVEDHEPTRIALTNLLTRRGYRVKAAATVAEARARAAEQEFQLLISDIGLPDGNGFDLMKELRAGAKGLQGIALTGYGMEQDVASSREAGFGSHLTKPVGLQSLESALAGAKAASLQAKREC